MRTCPFCGSELSGFPENCPECGEQLPEPEIADPFAAFSPSVPQEPVPVMQYRGPRQSPPEKQPDAAENPAAEAAEEPERPYEAEALPKRSGWLRILAALAAVLVICGIFAFLNKEKLFRRGEPAESWICCLTDNTACYWDEGIGTVKLPDLMPDSADSVSITRTADRETLFFPDRSLETSGLGYTLCRKSLVSRTAKTERMLPEERFAACCMDYRLLNEDGSRVLLLFRQDGKDRLYLYTNGAYRDCGEYEGGSVTLLNDSTLLNGTAYFLVTAQHQKDLAETLCNHLGLNQPSELLEYIEYAEDNRLEVSEENLLCYDTSVLYMISESDVMSTVRENILNYAMPERSHRYFFCCACDLEPLLSTEIVRYDLLNDARHDAVTLMFCDLYIQQKEIVPYPDGSCYLYNYPLPGEQNQERYEPRDLRFCRPDAYLQRIDKLVVGETVSFRFAHGDYPAVILKLQPGESELWESAAPVTCSAGTYCFTPDGNSVCCFQSDGSEQNDRMTVEIGTLRQDTENNSFSYSTYAAEDFLSVTGIGSDAVVFTQDADGSAFSVWLNSNLIMGNCLPGETLCDAERGFLYMILYPKHSSDGGTLYRIGSGRAEPIADNTVQMKLDEETGRLYVIDTDGRLTCPLSDHPDILKNAVSFLPAGIS